MNRRDELGVILEQGAQDWQIFQRDADDTATLDLSGRWTTPQPHKRATVVVRTDLAPVREFSSIELEVDGRRHGARQVTLDGDYFGGVELFGAVAVDGITGLPLGLSLADGEHLVSVALLDDAGARVATRETVVTLPRLTPAIVTIPRDCRGVSCGSGETCVDGRCGRVCLMAAGRPLQA